MELHELERDMADRFKASDNAIQQLRNQFNSLQELIRVLVAKQYVAAEDFVRDIEKPVSAGKPPLAVSYPRSKVVESPPFVIEEPEGSLDDSAYLKGRIEALEKSDMDMSSKNEELKLENRRLQEQLTL